VGKTTLAYQLAERFGISVLQIDDLQASFEKLTTPAQQPELHFWRTNWDEFRALSDSELVEHYIAVARRVFEPALVAVVAQHLAEHIPVIIEGDFLTPTLAAMADFEGEPNSGRVRALFLHEDQSQISANYESREGAAQDFRARASWLNGQWLQAECARLSVPLLSPRPWVSAAERAAAALES
jgi:2-phosphoglycerate kinase